MRFKKGIIPWNKGTHKSSKKKYYCKICRTEITKRAVKYGLGMCKSCSHKKENGFIPREWSKEQKENLSKSCQGRPSGFKGHRHTDKVKKLLSEQRIGVKHPELCGNNNPSKRLEVREKMSQTRKGRKLTEEWKKNLSKSMIGKNKGDKSGLWKGGITPEHVKIREDLKIWSKLILQRDNYTCQNCGQIGGRLEAHHIKEFSKYPQLRKVLSNGITLCKNCHKKLHKNYNF
jgi:5-methylcytosine-specific restriction endonuclease McrA